MLFRSVCETPNPGYRFINWTEGDTVVSTSASYDFTINGDRTLVANFMPVAAHDFDGDGKADILWRHSGGGVGMWLMDGATPKVQGSLGAIDTAWQIAGTASLVASTGDVDADSKADFFWRHSGGGLGLWLMNGISTKAQIGLGSVDTAWQIAGVGDFDGDGNADILWRHSSGALGVWLMDGTTVKAQVGLGTVDTAWQVVGIGDFDGDGKADILWRHSGGSLGLWLINGATVKSVLPNLTQQRTENQSSSDQSIRAQSNGSELNNRNPT